MNRKLTLGLCLAGGVVVAIVVVVVVLVYSSKWQPSGNETTKVSVRLAWLPGATFAGDYAALHNGYWQDAGLDVAINPGGFEHDAIKLVAGGADTFGITSGPQLLQARTSGVPIVAIGAVIPRSPIGWVAKKDSGITRPQGFVGKKVGAQFGTHTEITLEALCAKLGIDIKSFERVPIKFDPKPFVAGSIDVLPVYIIDQPIDLRQQGIDLNVIDPGDYGVSLAFGNVYFTTEETIRKNPELVRRFLAGARRGWIWANSNREKAADILASYATGTDKRTLREKLEATLLFIARDEKPYIGVFPMDAQRWTDTLDILRKYGELKGDIEVDRCFTNAFLGD